MGDTYPTEKLLAIVSSVHREVHNIFVWESDEDVWSVPEYWTRPILDTDWFNKPILRGDCDDFMLEVYYRLRQNHDFPKDMLRLTVCATERHVEHYDHAVLTIEYKDEDDNFQHLICDCNYKTPKSIEDLRDMGYKNFSMSKVGRPITEPWEKNQ